MVYPLLSLGMRQDAQHLECMILELFPTQRLDYAQMSHNLDKYIPEFDEDDAKSKLAGATPQELTDMLIDAYKEKRVIVKMLDAEMNRLRQIEEIIAEPSSLLKTPVFRLPTTSAA